MISLIASSGIKTYFATNFIMKIAAIDIGSNAIRFQVSSILERDDRILAKHRRHQNVSHGSHCAHKHRNLLRNGFRQLRAALDAERRRHRVRLVFQHPNRLGRERAKERDE